MNYGLVRVAAAVPKLRVADCEYNANNIIDIVDKAESINAQFVVFPELSITSYTCGDLFHQQALLKEAERQLGNIIEKTHDTGVVIIAGLPLGVDNQLFNCAVAVQGGKILGVVPKTYIPEHKEFSEKRWFASGSKALSDEISLCGQVVPFGTDILFKAEENSSVCFGIEICEDLSVPIPPSSYQAIFGATILFNLSASNEIVGRHEFREQIVKQQSVKCISGYVLTSAGVHESTTDVVFGGHALVAECGSILSESKRFSRDEQLIYSEIDIDNIISDRLNNSNFMELDAKKRFRSIKFKLRKKISNDISRKVNAHPFVPSDAGIRDRRCSEIFAIQTAGLAKRLSHTKMKHAVIGISGGLDSTLALLVTAKTFDILNIPRENIYAVTMPGFGTTGTTYNNSIELMKSIGTSIREINIKDACIQHFKDIGHDVDVHDVTYENVQARERTQILMDIANKINGLVIGTGDLSELALGWCTYNGDHMSMYSVNCDIPKTLVKTLVQWASENVMGDNIKDIVQNVLDTPISPELLPPDAEGKIDQKTEDIIGPYELHDFFLYHMIRYGAKPSKILFLAKHAFAGKYDLETIKKWLKIFLRKFFGQQFKRSCLPDGPKVGTISLSPRGDWRMPSDAEAAIWMKDIENK